MFDGIKVIDADGHVKPNELYDQHLDSRFKPDLEELKRIAETRPSKWFFGYFPQINTGRPLGFDKPLVRSGRRVGGPQPSRLPSDLGSLPGRGSARMLSRRHRAAALRMRQVRVRQQSFPPAFCHQPIRDHARLFLLVLCAVSISMRPTFETRTRELSLIRAGLRIAGARRSQSHIR
jgi:hypothetical protein